MAVAFKNRPEVSSPSLLDRLGVASLVGLVYLVGCLGIVFALLPYLWYQVLHPNLGAFASGSLLALLMIAVGVGLVFTGARLFSGHAVPGMRAGIFVGLIWLLINLLLTRWFSMWMEHWVYDLHWFGSAGVTVGTALTCLVLFILLAFQLRMFLKKGMEQFLMGFERQGWFTAAGFKPLQGLKVRRGTVFGLLCIVGAGIFTLVSHGTYKSRSWAINIPFSGKYIVQDPKDAARIDPNLQEGSTLDRNQWDELNDKLHSYVKVVFGAGFKANEVLPRTQYEERLKNLPAGVRANVKTKPVTLPSAYLDYRALVLLPDLQYTLPLVLLVGALWLSWRVVNIPTFADFLIATEAELNKVSWTTRRRLVQDTIVVLVTVFLLSFYLFSMDQVWRVVLSNRFVGVLRLQNEQSDQNTSIGQRKW